MTYKTLVYRWIGDDDTGHEEEFEVEGSVSPHVRGRYSGPPERCYPDEGGEVEIERVTRLTYDLDGRPVHPIQVVDADFLTADERSLAEENLSLEASDDDSWMPEWERDD